jgi:hypothetical protein
MSRVRDPADAPDVIINVRGYTASGYQVGIPEGVQFDASVSDAAIRSRTAFRDNYRCPR